MIQTQIVYTTLIRCSCAERWVIKSDNNGLAYELARFTAECALVVHRITEGCK